MEREAMGRRKEKRGPATETQQRTEMCDRRFTHHWILGNYQSCLVHSEKLVVLSAFTAVHL